MNRPFSDLSNHLDRPVENTSVRSPAFSTRKLRDPSAMPQPTGDNQDPTPLHPYSRYIASERSQNVDSLVTGNGAPFTHAANHSPSEVVIIDDDGPDIPDASSSTLLPSIKVISAASISSMLGVAVLDSAADLPAPDSAPAIEANAPDKVSSNTLAQPSVFRELLRRVVRMDNPRQRAFCVVCQQVRSCLFRIDVNVRSKNDFICSEKCLSQFYSSRDDISAPTSVPVTNTDVRPESSSSSSGVVAAARSRAISTHTTRITSTSPLPLPPSAASSASSSTQLSIPADTVATDWVSSQCVLCGADAALHLKSRLCLQTFVFCSAICGVRYLMGQSSKCEVCSTKLMTAFQGKFCVRFGNNVRQFCSMDCLNGYKRQLRSCCYCHATIVANVSAATVNTRSGVKFMCSSDCLKQYKIMQKRGEPLPAESCSVCSKLKSPEYQFLLQPNEAVKALCSTPCFKAHTFVVAQNSNLKQCMVCRVYFVEKNMSQFSVNFLRFRHTFCSQRCSNVFVVSKRYIVSCFSCKVRKYNFDMFELTDTELTYCSALCLKSSGFDLPMLFSCNCAICGRSMETPIFLSLSGDAYCSSQCLATANNTNDLQPVVRVSTSVSAGIDCQRIGANQTHSVSSTSRSNSTAADTQLSTLPSPVSSSSPTSSSTSVSLAPTASTVIHSSPVASSVPAESTAHRICAMLTSQFTSGGSVTLTVSSAQPRPLCSTGQVNSIRGPPPPYRAIQPKPAARRKSAGRSGVKGTREGEVCVRVVVGVPTRVGMSGAAAGDANMLADLSNAESIATALSASDTTVAIAASANGTADSANGTAHSAHDTAASSNDTAASSNDTAASSNDTGVSIVASDTAASERIDTWCRMKRSRPISSTDQFDGDSGGRKRLRYLLANDLTSVSPEQPLIEAGLQSQDDSLHSLLGKLKQLLHAKLDMCNASCQTDVLFNEHSTQTPAVHLSDKSIGGDLISDPTSHLPLNDSEIVDEVGGERISVARSGSISSSRICASTPSHVDNSTALQVADAPTLDQVDEPLASEVTGRSWSDQAMVVALTGGSASDLASSTVPETSVCERLRHSDSTVLPVFVPVPVYVPVPIPDSFTCPYPVPVPLVVPMPLPVPIPIPVESVESAKAMVRDFQKPASDSVTDENRETSNITHAESVAHSEGSDRCVSGDVCTSTIASGSLPPTTSNSTTNSTTPPDAVSLPDPIISGTDLTTEDVPAASSHPATIDELPVGSPDSIASTGAFDLDSVSSPCAVSMRELSPPPTPAPENTISLGLLSLDEPFSGIAVDGEDHSTLPSVMDAISPPGSAPSCVSSPTPDLVSSSASSTVGSSTFVSLSSSSTVFSRASSSTASSALIVSPSIPTTLHSSAPSVSATSPVSTDVCPATPSIISTTSTDSSYSHGSVVVSTATNISKTIVDRQEVKEVSPETNASVTDADASIVDCAPVKVVTGRDFSLPTVAVSTTGTIDSMAGQQIISDDSSDVLLDHPATDDISSNEAGLGSTTNAAVDTTRPEADRGSRQSDVAADPSGLSGLELALESVRESLRVQDTSSPPTEESTETTVVSKLAAASCPNPADGCVGASLTPSVDVINLDCSDTGCGGASSKSPVTGDEVAAPDNVKLPGSNPPSVDSVQFCAGASDNNGVDVEELSGDATKSASDNVHEATGDTPEFLPVASPITVDLEDHVTVLSDDSVISDRGFDPDDPDDPDDRDVLSIKSVDSDLNEPGSDLQIDSVVSCSEESRSAPPVQSCESTQSVTALSVQPSPDQSTERIIPQPVTPMSVEASEPRAVLPVFNLSDGSGNSLAVDWNELIDRSSQPSPLINCDNCYHLLHRLAAWFDVSASNSGEKPDVLRLLSCVLKQFCSSDSLLSSLSADRLLLIVIGVREWQISRGQPHILCSVEIDTVSRYLHYLLRPLARKFITAVDGEPCVLNGPSVCVTEEQLWQCHVLGAHSPLSLLCTVLYFNSKLLGITDLEDHCSLSFNMFSLDSSSQTLNFSRDLNFKSSVSSVPFQPVADGPFRCPVQYFIFYLSKCPGECVRNRDSCLYLCPDSECTSDSTSWFTSSPVPPPLLRVLLYRLLCTSQLQTHLFGS